MRIGLDINLLEEQMELNYMHYGYFDGCVSLIQLENEYEHHKNKRRYGFHDREEWNTIQSDYNRRKAELERMPKL